MYNLDKQMVTNRYQYDGNDKDFLFLDGMFIDKQNNILWVIEIESAIEWISIQLE